MKVVLDGCFILCRCEGCLKQMMLVLNDAYIAGQN